MLTGLACIIASGCVFNNFTDRAIDKKMKRTRKRVLVEELVPAKAALIFGTALGLAGALILAVFTNLLTLAAALLGFIFYVVIYGIFKRRSVHGTLVGTLSGAVPPVVGYLSVSNNLDLAAGLLFLILIFWQMPHFYAIAIYRSKDYAAASIPVLPVVKGVRTTKIQMVLYIVAFTIAASFLTIYGYSRDLYLIAALFLGLTWFIYAIKGFAAKDDILWAKKLFFFSLIVITGWCAAVTADSFIKLSDLNSGAMSGIHFIRIAK